MSFFAPQNPGIGGLDELTLSEEIIVQTISALGTPGYFLRTNLAGTTVEWVAGTGGGAASFTDLTDVPSSYTGQALKYVRVNAGATGLEFSTPAGGGDVVGPSSAVNNNIAVFDLTTGKLIKDGGATIAAIQANTTNVTAAGALMDSEVTNLAAVKAFDPSAYAPALGVDDNYVTDAEKTVIANTSGTNTGDNATNTQYSGLAASKQDVLVSGTNIKTINSTSLLGSGDIAISGSVSDGDKGDITVSGSGTVWSIDNDTIGLDELSATGTASASTYLRGDNTWSTPAGGGDVVGPAGATDNSIVRYDSTTGKLIQNSLAYLGDTGSLNIQSTDTDISFYMSNSEDDEITLELSSGYGLMQINIPGFGYFYTDGANAGINSYSAGATGATLSLQHSSASPASSDSVGSIQFIGKDSLGNNQDYAAIEGSIADYSSGFESGYIRFSVADNAILSKKLELSPDFLAPYLSNGLSLGVPSLGWSDLFLSEGGVINWDDGDVTLTQTGNILAVAGGDLRVATAGVGTNADSVPTISSTSTLTNKNIVSSINAQTGTTYTLVASDAGKVVTCTNASAITVTIPDDVFAAGEKVLIIQGGAGSVTISAGAGVTLNRPASITAAIGEEDGSRGLLFTAVDQVTMI